MKNIVAFVLAVIMMFSLCACGNDTNAEGKSDDVKATDGSKSANKLKGAFQTESPMDFDTADIVEIPEVLYESDTGVILAINQDKKTVSVINASEKPCLDGTLC